VNPPHTHGAQGSPDVNRSAREGSPRARSIGSPGRYRAPQRASSVASDGSRGACTPESATGRMSPCPRDAHRLAWPPSPARGLARHPFLRRRKRQRKGPSAHRSAATHTSHCATASPGRRPTVAPHRANAAGRSSGPAGVALRHQRRRAEQRSSEGCALRQRRRAEQRSSEGCAPPPYSASMAPSSGASCDGGRGNARVRERGMEATRADAHPGGMLRARGEPSRADRFMSGEPMTEGPP
jgi:hypothetical protein